MNIWSVRRYNGDYKTKFTFYFLATPPLFYMMCKVGGIGAGSALMNIWSVRRYIGDYKTKFTFYILATPILFYGMCKVGALVGDICTGRNAEYGRDRFLGQLPGKTYYSPNSED